MVSYISPPSPAGQLQRKALPTGAQSPPLWHGLGMQDVSSISQRPPVKPAMQLHTKPVGREREIGRLKNSAVSEIESAAARVVASRDQMNPEKVP